MVPKSKGTDEIIFRTSGELYLGSWKALGKFYFVAFVSKEYKLFSQDNI